MRKVTGGASELRGILEKKIERRSRELVREVIERGAGGEIEGRARARAWAKLREMIRTEVGDGKRRSAGGGGNLNRRREVVGDEG